VSFVIELFRNALSQTLVSMSHNWPFLLASIMIAGILKSFVDADKVSSFLNRFKGASVLAATLAAVATPLCSCGTTAVILGMMASTMPWAPIVAFMVASPLSSPEGMIYSAGLFGWPFATYYFASSILLGLAGGGLAMTLQKAGFLNGQVRFSAKAEAPVSKACGCSGGAGAVAVAAAVPELERPSAKTRLAEFAKAVLDVAKTILPMFVGFAFLGYLLNGLIPASAIGALFGAGRAYGVPLAATIGLPLYVNSEASMPLVRALQDSGMSPGAIMAFLIAGSGTSIGAIGGALTIARWKVVGLVVAVLWAGAIAVGYGYNALLELNVM
jgi:uncharacterized membrane protein YraQ (UPF0718 family)